MTKSGIWVDVRPQTDDRRCGGSEFQSAVSGRFRIWNSEDERLSDIENAKVVDGNSCVVPVAGSGEIPFDGSGV